MVHDGAYTPASHVGDVQSPATLTSVGSAVSVFMAPDAGTTERNSDEMGVDFAPALPPIRNSYNQSVLSPKIPASHAPSVQRPLPPRLHTPKVGNLSLHTTNKYSNNLQLHCKELRTKRAWVKEFEAWVLRGCRTCVPRSLHILAAILGICNMCDQLSTCKLSVLSILCRLRA